jgi:lipopolysaccharide export system permease protein
MLNNKQLNIFIDSLSNIYTEREKLVITGIRYNEILNNQILDKISPDSTTNDTTAAQLYPTHIDSIINNLRADRRLTVLTTAHRNAHQNQRVILQYQNDLYSRMIWINKHVVELHKKYSLSLACLLFFFIGAPLGAIIRKGGFGMPVVVSILLFMLYYLISAISEKVAREGVWEMSLILWLPTALFIAIGISLTHQAVTDSLILNKEAYNIFISKINFVKFLKSKKKKK